MFISRHVFPKIMMYLSSDSSRTVQSDGQCMHSCAVYAYFTYRTFYIAEYQTWTANQFIVLKNIECFFKMKNLVDQTHGYIEFEFFDIVKVQPK